MKEYGTEIRDQKRLDGSSITPVEQTEKENKKKYQLAMKLLGEKELEVAVLKNKNEL